MLWRSIVFTVRPRPKLKRTPYSKCSPVVYFPSFIGLLQNSFRMKCTPTLNMFPYSTSTCFNAQSFLDFLPPFTPLGLGWFSLSDVVPSRWSSNMRTLQKNCLILVVIIAKKKWSKPPVTCFQAVFWRLSCY